MIGLFTPTDTALLLIDHQLGTMKLINTVPRDVVRRNTPALAKAAKILNIPVVLTSSQKQNFQGPSLPELEQILPETFTARVQRTGIVNAWNDPDFKKAVAGKGRINSGLEPAGRQTTARYSVSRRIAAYCLNRHHFQHLAA